MTLSVTGASFVSILAPGQAQKYRLGVKVCQKHVRRGGGQRASVNSGLKGQRPGGAQDLHQNQIEVPETHLIENAGSLPGVKDHNMEGLLWTRPKEGSVGSKGRVH